MAGANDEDMYDVALAHPIDGEAATSKRQRLNIADPKEKTRAAPSLQSSSHQLTAGEVHASPQDTLPLPTLPHELIVDILSRLPVKFLLHFRCVWKSWKSLISDPQFVKKHLIMSIMNPKFAHHRLILSFLNRNFYVKSCSVESIYGYHAEAIKLKYPLRWRGTSDEIVGSYNGLICFSNDQNHVLIWNPSIRIFKKSPDLGNDVQREECFTVYGFGYDHINDSYKAVAIFCCRSLGGYKTRVKVFTPSADYWRVIQPLPAGIVPKDDSGKCVSGTLNWGADRTTASGSSWVIISLDLRNESYQDIMQPDYEAVESFPTLGVLRDCLCIFCEYRGTRSDVWLMKEYGVKESWTKLLTIPCFSGGSSVPLFISGNGVVLLRLLRLESQDSCLVLYNSNGTMLWHPVIPSTMLVHPVIRSIRRSVWVETQVYVESLISPV